jgi:hypothetical protein
VDAQRLANAVERKQTFVRLVTYPLSGVTGLLPLRIARGSGRAAAQASQGVTQYGQHQPSERSVIVLAFAAVVVLGPRDYVADDKLVDYVHLPFVLSFNQSNYLIIQKPSRWRNTSISECAMFRVKCRFRRP